MNVIRLVQNKRHIYISKEKEMNTIREMGWNNRFTQDKVKGERPSTQSSNRIIKNQLKRNIEGAPKTPFQPYDNNFFTGQQKPTAYERESNFANDLLYDRFSDVLYDELNNIPKLWDELGVTELYRLTFINVSMGLDFSIRKEYFDHEVRSLTKFQDMLKKLSLDIYSREKALLLLKQFAEYLKSSELNDRVLQDIISTIKNYRVLCINIVNSFHSIREYSSYHVGVKKYNLENLLKLFNYDKHYLVKMKNDTDFLINTPLNKYFGFAADSDPFLVCVSEPEFESKYDFAEGGNSERRVKMAIPIDEAMQSTIKNCQFLMLDDLIYFEMESKQEVGILQFERSQTGGANRTAKSGFRAKNAYLVNYLNEDKKIKNKYYSPEKTSAGGHRYALSKSNLSDKKGKIEVEIRNKEDLDSHKEFMSHINEQDIDLNTKKNNFNTKTESENKANFEANNGKDLKLKPKVDQKSGAFITVKSTKETSVKVKPIGDIKENKEAKKTTSSNQQEISVKDAGNKKDFSLDPKHLKPSNTKIQIEETRKDEKKTVQAPQDAITKAQSKKSEKITIDDTPSVKKLESDGNQSESHKKESLKVSISKKSSKNINIPKDNTISNSSKADIHTNNRYIDNKQASNRSITNIEEDNNNKEFNERFEELNKEQESKIDKASSNNIFIENDNTTYLKLGYKDSKEKNLESVDFSEKDSSLKNPTLDQGKNVTSKHTFVESNKVINEDRKEEENNVANRNEIIDEDYNYDNFEKKETLKENYDEGYNEEFENYNYEDEQIEDNESEDLKKKEEESIKKSQQVAEAKKLEELKRKMIEEEKRKEEELLIKIKEEEKKRLEEEENQRRIKLEEEQREKEEEEKLKKQKEEEERLIKQKEEEERLKKKKIEEERLIKQKEEEERLRKQKEEEERLVKQKEEEERLIKQKEEEEEEEKERINEEMRKGEEEKLRIEKENRQRFEEDQKQEEIARQQMEELERLREEEEIEKLRQEEEDERLRIEKEQNENKPLFKKQATLGIEEIEEFDIELGVENNDVKESERKVIEINKTENDLIDEGLDEFNIEDPKNNFIDNPKAESRLLQSASKRIVFNDEPKEITVESDSSMERREKEKKEREEKEREEKLKLEMKDMEETEKEENVLTDKEKLMKINAKMSNRNLEQILKEEEVNDEDLVKSTEKDISWDNSLNKNKKNDKDTKELDDEWDRSDEDDRAKQTEEGNQREKKQEEEKSRNQEEAEKVKREEEEAERLKLEAEEAERIRIEMEEEEEAERLRLDEEEADRLRQEDEDKKREEEEKKKKENDDSDEVVFEKVEEEKTKKIQNSPLVQRNSFFFQENEDLKLNEEETDNVANPSKLKNISDEFDRSEKSEKKSIIKQEEKVVVERKIMKEPSLKVEELDDFEFDFGDNENKKLKTDILSEHKEKEKIKCSPSEEVASPNKQTPEHEQNLPKKDQDIEIDPSKFSFSFFNSDLSEINGLYYEFLEEVNEAQKIALKIKLSLDQYLLGVNPKIVQMFYNNKLCGFACISYESHSDNYLTISLKHFSTNLFSKYKEVLDAFIAYLCENLAFDEIVVDLYYEKQVHDFEINTFIRDTYKSLRFKWVKLENTISERFVKMSKKFAQRELVCNNYKHCKFLISLRYFMSVSLDEEIDDFGQIEHHNEFEINILPFMSVLHSRGNELLVDQTLYNSIKENNEFTHLNNKYAPCFTGGVQETLEAFKKSIAENLSGFTQTPEALCFTENAVISSSIMNFNTRVSSLTSIILNIDGNNVVFLRVGGDIKVLRNKETRQLAYIFNSTDDNHTIIIGDFQIDNQNGNVHKKFLDIFYNFEPVEVKVTHLFIPAFKSMKNAYYTLPDENKILPGLEISKDGDKVYLTRIFENYELSLNYDTNIQNSPIVNVEDDDRVIENDFTLIIMSTDYADLGIPSAFIKLVSKDEFVKMT